MTSHQVISAGSSYAVSSSLRRSSLPLYALIWFTLAPLSLFAQGKQPTASVVGESIVIDQGGWSLDAVLVYDEVRLVGTQAFEVNAANGASRAAGLGEAIVTPISGMPHAFDLRLAAPSGKSRAAHATSLAAFAADPNVQVEAVIYRPGSTERKAEQRISITPTLAVKPTAPGALPALLAKYSLELVEEPDYAPGSYILRPLSNGSLDALEAADRIRNAEQVEFSTVILRRVRPHRAAPNDPQYGQQWHLKNNGPTNAVGGVAGNDLNVESVWPTYTGQGINIGVTDEGVQTNHPDFVGNIRTDIDRDVSQGDDDPNPPDSTFDHGTSVAGVAAARGNNGVGVSGAAWNAGIVGIKLTDQAITDAQEATAMGWKASETVSANQVHINNNSWGPLDDGATLEGPGALSAAAIANGINVGRNGKGIIYAWAAGNGRCESDDINLDGYSNSRYTIAIGASGVAGEVSWYSESGAAMLVNAPSSSGSCASRDTEATTTVTTGSGYTNAFNGTSSSTPAAAGVMALILQANSNLNWRDMQHLLVHTSTRTQTGDASWAQNGAGRWYNPSYGFGRVNAAAATTAAATWVTVPASATALTASEAVPTAIPDNNVTGISRTLTISGSSYFRAEHVEVTANITHPYRGDLRIKLVSPSGMVSELMKVRNDEGDNYSNWTFMTVAHWGENPNGVWTLRIADEGAADVGSLSSWTLRVHGFIEEYSAQYGPDTVGEGTVQASIAPNAQGRYAGGTQVTFTAIPANGFTFVNWTGTTSSTQNPLQITVGSAVNLTANFSPSGPTQYTLNATASPAEGGSVGRNPASGTGKYDANTQVTLTAQPSGGYTFLHWSGDATGSSNPTVVTMAGDRTVTAVFGSSGGTGVISQQFSLLRESVPAEGGAIGVSPGPRAGDQYAENTTVQLTAQLASGYTFRGWFGDASGSATTTSVAMTDHQHVFAAFRANGGNDAYEPNNDYTRAQPVAIKSGNPQDNISTVSGLVLSAGDEDWYRLRLPALTHLRIDAIFSHAQGNIQMQLWDRRSVYQDRSWGQAVGESYTATNDEAITFANLTNPADLYLRVYTEGGTGNPAYVLSFTTTDIDDQYDVTTTNNSACETVPTLALNTTHEDLVLRDEDWYRLTLPNGTTQIDVDISHFFFSGDLNFMVIGDVPGDCGGVYSRIVTGGYGNDAGQNRERVTNINVSGRTSVLLRVYGANSFMRNQYDLRVDAR